MSSAVDSGIDNILLTYLHKKTFSGCAVAFSDLTERDFYYKGKTDKVDSAKDIDETTLFDLASLTKPLVTVLSLLALKKEGKIAFEDTLAHHLAFSLPADKKNIKIIDLLGHTSGLPAHKPYFKEINNTGDFIDTGDVVKMILLEDLVCDPGDLYIYSDLDYILLGYLIEELSGESLGSFWLRKIAEPLGISKEFFCQNTTKNDISSGNFAVTGVCGWSGVKLLGKVNDDNCRAMNRLSGHAGLFGTLPGVLKFCEELLFNFLGRKENSIFCRDDFLFLLKKRERKQWACGFDVPTGDNSSSGQFFSKNSIGHLGFTGTSFWIDLEKKRIVVFLTNRVIYGEDTKKIKEMRPLLHNALLKGKEVRKNK